MTDMMTVGICQREDGKRDSPGRGCGEGVGAGAEESKERLDSVGYLNY